MCITILSDAYSCAARRRRPQPDSRRARRARVAVAGATGYTGQELLRLLSRHPGVTLTAAMSSGADRRRRRAACRRWRGCGTAPSCRSSPETLAREADVVFLALPDSGRRGARRRRSSTPASASSTCRGAFRLRDDAARARAGIRRRTGCRRASPTASPSASAAPSRARSSSPTRAATRPATLLALAPLVEAGLLARRTADVIVDAKSGVSGAGKTPSERTHFSEIHGSLSAYGVFNHRHGAEIEQGLRTRRSPSRRTCCRSIAASCRPSTCASRRARPRRRSATCSSRRMRARTFVRLVGSSLPEIKHVAHTNFCDIGWRVDPSGRAILGVGHRQPAEGRVGPGRAEHERDARPRRADGAAVTATRPLVIKFGGELLEDRAHLATVVAARRGDRRRAARRWSSSTAAARRSTPR